MQKMAAAFVAIAALAIAVSAQSVSADKGYYNLTKQGFNGFKSTIDPNWEVILGPTATADNLKIFRALRFSMTVDANGVATVSHEIVNPDKIRLEPYVNQIHGNVNRLVTSFFRTWAMFVVSPASETDLKEWKLTTPNGIQTIKPQFQKTRSGLLLSSYHSNFEPSALGIKTTLDVQVEYQELSGMQLPHRIRIKGIHGGELVEAELEFNQYVLNPR
ncbi:MAG TPA: hypothetical protein VIT88_06250 [Pyrinomonadaceae bacterium]